MDLEDLVLILSEISQAEGLMISLYSEKVWKSFSHIQVFETPMACSLPGSSVCGILQSRIFKWVAVCFSRGSSQPRDQTQISHIVGRFLPAEPQGKPRSPTLQADSLPAEPEEKPKNTGVGSLPLLQQIFLTQESNWGLLYYRGIFFTNWTIRQGI